MAGQRWEADSSAELTRRWGKSSHELGNTSGDGSCPDTGERLIIIPRSTMIAAKADVPDA
ncbi:hypothetical protein GCM10012279_48740 [Micromonospora yangpuensis]|uniref:Uncharacterized protein n=1 Tax=Micromonospora yangpuensis TaxID=683228 RepID=A0A1C6UTT6_9ACTN|nr:hypothetical protein GCM10012279_48740 [Micromonospora yangpuensis]SCL57437.1 hypothetical protein GA0070617_3526 [Micromonospora yangpuensis]